MILVNEGDLYDLALDVEECYYFETNDVSKKLLRLIADRLFALVNTEDAFDDELARDRILEQQEMLDYAQDDYDYGDY